MNVRIGYFGKAKQTKNPATGPKKQTSQFAVCLKILQREPHNATPATIEPARRGGFRSTTLSLIVLRKQRKSGYCTQPLR